MSTLSQATGSPANRIFEYQGVESLAGNDELLAASLILLDCIALVFVEDLDYLDNQPIRNVCPALLGQDPPLGACNLGRLACSMADFRRVVAERIGGAIAGSQMISAPVTVSDDACSHVIWDSNPARLAQRVSEKQNELKEGAAKRRQAEIDRAVEKALAKLAKLAEQETSQGSSAQEEVA